MYDKLPEETLKTHIREASAVLEEARSAYRAALYQLIEAYCQAIEEAPEADRGKIKRRLLESVPPSVQRSCVQICIDQNPNGGDGLLNCLKINCDPQ